MRLIIGLRIWPALFLLLAAVACQPQQPGPDATTPAPATPSARATAPLAMVPAEAASTLSPAPVAPVATITPDQTQAATEAALDLPACTRGQVTPAQTEGPYWKANSPERTSLLEPGTEGTRLLITGYVLTAACRPVAGALVDFWQADSTGVYDNIGYRLRGHLFTDAQGRYTLETVIPGEYAGRTEHIHVKVQAPGGPVLTTQLYFPGAAQNSSDGIFDARLLMDVENAASGVLGRFTFVLPGT